MELTETADLVTGPGSHYIFLEKTSLIPKNAPSPWAGIPAVTSPAQELPVVGFLSSTAWDEQVYPAGASV
jgi:hypothetical protein